MIGIGVVLLVVGFMIYSNAVGRVLWLVGAILITCGVVKALVTAINKRHRY